MKNGQIVPELSENALHVLSHRYLMRHPDGSSAETPADLFRRVAAAVAEAETQHGGDARAAADEFYELMARGLFLPNSPTLMNAGRDHGMLSACFVLPVEDSVERIFESIKEAALIQKAGGGTGFAFDRLRPTGDYIASSGRTTSGPISFWKVFSEATNAIQQGAFRRGANMGMMDAAHPDILKFITAKGQLGAFENFNISVKVGDALLAALVERPEAPHVVVNPRTGLRYLIPRGLDIAAAELRDLAPADEPGPGPFWTLADLWDLIVRSAHATGEPGLCFIDRINQDNPTPLLGPIRATNPCGEQPLLDHEACNLGSINLARLVAAGPDGRAMLDEPAFRRLIRQGVRFLDDVIDAGSYVVEPIRRICLGNRKIGLGVMGFADALLELGIRYDSEQAVELGDRVAGILAQEAFAASEELARQRGSFPNWIGSRWDTVHHRPMRNAAVTTVAPTGTLSILAGCSGGIEPVFALAFWRTILGGQRLLEVNPVFRRVMQQRGLWREEFAYALAGGTPLAEIAGVPEDVRRVFVTAHEVPPERHVEMQATFQRHIDGAISKTINLPASACPTDVAAVFLLAWRTGCKGITVYRHGCRPAQPMSYAATDSAVSRGPRPRYSAGGEPCPRCLQELDVQIACSRCPRCGYTLCG